MPKERRVERLQSGCSVRESRDDSRGRYWYVVTVREVVIMAAKERRSQARKLEPLPPDDPDAPSSRPWLLRTFFMAGLSRPTFRQSRSHYACFPPLCPNPDSAVGCRV